MTNRTYSTPLRRLGLVALGVALLATIMSVIRAQYMPHYAGTANTPNAGFNTWYWHLIDCGSILLWLIGVITGAVSWRSRIGRMALTVSVLHVAFILYDLKNWLPDF